MLDDEYEELVFTTSIYPFASTGLPFAIDYCLFGMTSEVGELAGKWKKFKRDSTPVTREDWRAELGDVLWYATALANECGITLTELKEYNAEKLRSRLKRGTISGSGDNR